MDFRIGAAGGRGRAEWFNRAFALGAGLCLAAYSSGVGAALDISQVPLTVSTSVAPNIFFEVDDSGSMDWTVLSRKHWHACAYDPDNGDDADASDDCGWLVDNGRFRSYDGSSWRYFSYVYDSPDDAYSNGCTNTYAAAENCLPGNGPLVYDWRIRSAAVNVVYYNPAVTYQPWPGMADASFTAVRSDPQSGTSGYSSTRDLSGLVYEVATDDSGFDTGDGRPNRGSNRDKTATPNGLIDLWDSHTQVTVNGATASIAQYTYDSLTDTDLNPTVTTTTLSGGGCFPELGGGAVACRTLAEAQQNIANWYQYHRRRAFVAKSAISEVIDQSPNYRYGLSVINNHSDLFVETPAAGDNLVTHNNDLLDQLFSFNWPAAGTPLRRGLERVGQYFDNDLTGHSDPILYSCQQNFSVLFTDGYWNGGDPDSVIGDSDGDGVDRSLADVGHYYYEKDLSPLANNVPPNPFDDATHQHMVSFTVAFGVEGNLVDSDDDGWPNPALAEADDWGDAVACSDCPEKIDDMWHTAYNSRGTFVSAQTPVEVVDAIGAALINIADRTSSAAAIASNSTRLDTNTLIYQAKYDSSDWSGDLLAYNVDPASGDVGTLEWSASDQLTDHAGREVYTWNDDTTAGVEFKTLTDLSAAQQADLGGSQALLDYLRGDHSAEEQNGGSYRNRSSLLGDIINSDPWFVGQQNYGYSMLEEPSGSAYATFIGSSLFRNRTPMVYVGANDGMLHALDAETGEEKFAYVPNSIFANLTDLAAPAYSHRYFVDASPRAGAAYVDLGSGDAWRTLLLGATGAGGKGVFALDVTDPDNFASGDVLWEFNHAELGYTIGQPTIVRIQSTGQWVALFGNGYGSASQTARLFIVDLASGALIRAIDTEAGDAANPNCMATPIAVDSDGDRSADVIYAGDLLGNLWKFDIDSTNTSQWKSAFYSGATPAPLFTAVNDDGEAQPITSKPQVGTHPDGGLMVYVGTGKYFEVGDNSVPADPVTQSLYGIWDNGSEVSRGELLEQEIVYEDSQSFQDPVTLDIYDHDIRLVSQNAMTTEKGWYIDLVSPPPASLGEQGERVVSAPLLWEDRVIFTTLIPDPDVCAFGGTSWLMEVDPITGGRLDFTVFDLNSDGEFNSDEYVTVTINGSEVTIPVSGRRSLEGIIKTPGVISAGDVAYKYTSGSTGQVEVTANRGVGTSGRQSWQQLQ